MNVQQSHDKLVDQNRALSLECSSLKDEIKDLLSCHESTLKEEAAKLKKTNRNRGINESKRHKNNDTKK